MPLRLGRREFRPAFWPSLAYVLLLPLLVRLGIWQLDRAAEKQAILDAIAAAEQASPRPLSLPLAEVDALNYRKFVVRGEYLQGRDYLLDNQPHGGRVGYHVLTPLRLSAWPQQCVLVDRGWVAQGRDRQDLPVIVTPTGEQEITASVWLSWRDSFRLGDGARSNPGWPAVIQWIEPDAMAEELPCRPLPLVLRLDADAEGGFVRDWPAPRIEPEKSISYAVQWFALATALTLIYIFVNLKKIEPPPADGNEDANEQQGN